MKIGDVCKDRSGRTGVFKGYEPGSFGIWLVNGEFEKIAVMELERVKAAASLTGKAGT
jgi:Zn-finger nucleic acid-binding protein